MSKTHSRGWNSPHFPHIRMFLLLIIFIIKRKMLVCSEDPIILAMVLIYFYVKVWLFWSEMILYAVTFYHQIWFAIQLSVCKCVMIEGTISWYLAVLVMLMMIRPPSDLAGNGPTISVSHISPLTPRPSSRYQMINDLLEVFPVDCPILKWLLRLLPRAWVGESNQQSQIGME